MPAKQRGGRGISSVRLGDNELIAIGDSVLVNSDSQSGMPYVARIKEFYPSSDPEGETMMHVMWFYRPEEAYGGRKAFHADKELFTSDHMDTVAVSTVLCKCRVTTLKKYLELDQVGANDFFARFTYRSTRQEFEPDRVPVFCTCEMPYNPDKFMIMCDQCEEWYHPECLGLAKEPLRHVRNWTCPPCIQLAASAAGMALEADANAKHPAS